jgi:hypothetical protein
MAGEKQWLRYFRLTLILDEGDRTTVWDLSDFRVKFHVTQAMTGRPCTAEISVYNVADATCNAIPAPTNAYVKNRHIRVLIEAGYQEKHGLIFDGDLWWKSQGRESETDTYLRLIAATGDRAHQFSTVCKTLPAGATQSDVLGQVALAYKKYGIGMNAEISADYKLPRGKVLYGMTHDAMQHFADTNLLCWGYGTRGVTAIPREGAIPEADRVIVLNASTGLLDRPEITTAGIRARALMNPDLEFGRIVQIDTSTVQTGDYSTASESSAIEQNQQATGAKSDANGLYVIKYREHTGDTRGGDWYTDIQGIGYNAEVKTTSGDIMAAVPNFK